MKWIELQEQNICSSELSVILPSVFGNSLLFCVAFSLVT